MKNYSVKKQKNRENRKTHKSKKDKNLIVNKTKTN